MCRNSVWWQIVICQCLSFVTFIFSMIPQIQQQFVAPYLWVNECLLIQPIIGGEGRGRSDYEIIGSLKQLISVYHIGMCTVKVCWEKQINTGFLTYVALLVRALVWWWEVLRSILVVVRSSYKLRYHLDKSQ